MSMKEVDAIRPVVKGCYDVQMLRLQTGMRLASNFLAKLGKHKDEDVDLEKEAEKILDQLRASYKMLTSAIARNRTLPDKKGFTGDPLISTYPELVLVHQFINLEKEEDAQFRILGNLLVDVPVYSQYLANQVGVGPAMGGMLVSKFNPYRARHASSFHKFAGIDVGPDGRGRSRRVEHQVLRTYTKKDGSEGERMSLTYDPWVKTKLFVLAACFLRLGSPWCKVYYDYKHRLESDPAREKCTVEEYKRRHKKGEPVDHLWPPGHINNASKRYMIKMFLTDFWVFWRTMEGLPVTKPYAEAKLGFGPHGQAAE